uniref:acid phosphatase n=1 Tax=Dermatophagoides pteronyssinus TaxID=6956 RepID=A0A6P6YKN5_DERPT|nr:prostatic acid phosphatase-like [Dermatophagoides pteronyssinus]
MDSWNIWSFLTIILIIFDNNRQSFSIGNNEVQGLSSSKSWTSNDQTILRHVQIVFRHGDRTPVWVEPPEPYYEKHKYWPQGFGQLTKQGKAKAYRLGQLLRKYYSDYLGWRFSVQEVFIRSSALDRCIETAQLIMAGAYPPNSSLARWNISSTSEPLAKLWQPTPIESFIPADEDTLLRINKPCPEADEIKERLLDSRRNRRLLQRYRPLLDQLERILSDHLHTIEQVSNVHENMNIMHENGYYWYKWEPESGNRSEELSKWTQESEEEIRRQLRLFEVAKYRSMFDDDFIKQVRAGELLHRIGDIFKSRRSVMEPASDSDRDYRLHLYSTHDTKLAALLQTLNVWNQELVPYLGTLMFELHQSRENSSQYYVQLWYLNETADLLEAQELRPHRLDIPGCDQEEFDEQNLMCPLDEFLFLIQPFSPPQDWKHSCGIHSELTAMISVNILLLIVNLTMMFFLLMGIMYVCSCINSRSGYERLR